ncbi:hypothetical protein Ancab_024843 [Ancistrocladus abbreviatus]
MDDDLPDHRCQLLDSDYDIHDDDDDDYDFNNYDNGDSYEYEREAPGGEEPLMLSSANGKMMLKLRVPKKEESISSSSSSASSSTSSSSTAVGNDDIDNNNNNEKEVVKKRICSICDTVFSSGKALGGHMRVHVQFHKSNDLSEIPLPKLKLKKVKRSLLVAGEDSKRKWRNYNSKDYNLRDLIMRNGRPTCSLCNKTFPSPKSLFGHMRCHPERQWRGMLPPPPPPPFRPPVATKNSSSSTVSDTTSKAIRREDQFDSTATTPTTSAAAAAATSGPVIVVDLLQSISGWSMTAKRGRKSLISSSSAAAENDQIPDTAVLGLLMLANSGERNFNCISSPPPCEKKQQPKLEIDCETRSNCHLEGQEIGDRERLCDYYISSKRKMGKQLQIELEAKREINLSKWPTSKKLRIEERAESVAASVTNGLGLPRIEERDNSESLKFFMEKEPAGVEVDGEKNDNEMMSRKKRRKRRMTKMIRDLELQLEEVEVEVEVEVEEEVALIEGKGEAEKYRCTTCNKCFPTHQALGGHRSGHYKFKNYYFMEGFAPAPAPAPAAAFATTATPTQDDHIYEGKVAAASAAAELTLSTSAAAIHSCKICNKTFPSGQALGGHKRYHWAGKVGGISTAESSSAAAGSSVFSVEIGSERAAERRILSFDLNELPAIEEEAAAAVENESTLSLFPSGPAACLPSSSFSLC